MFILDGSCGWLPENTMLLIHNLYNIVRFLIPVLIVIMGAMDFVKSIASANNDAIRKNTNAFVQKLIAAAIAFIIPATVNQIAKVIGDNYSSNAMVCVNQILNGEYKASEGLHVTDPVPKPKEDKNNNNTTTTTQFLLGYPDQNSVVYGAVLAGQSSESGGHSRDDNEDNTTSGGHSRQENGNVWR